MSLPAIAGTSEEDVQAFKKTLACLKGLLVTEDPTYAQCAMSDIGAKASITASSDGYRDITITIDGDSSGKYSEIQKSFLLTMLQQGAVIFGKTPDVADNFKSLPLSDNPNKITKFNGVEFNIPSVQSLATYNNYMVTMTK